MLDTAERMDFVAVSKLHYENVSNRATDILIEQQSFEDEMSTKLDDIQSQLNKGDITQVEYNTQKQIILDKTKEGVHKWQQMTRYADKELFQQIIPEFEKCILGCDEDNMSILLRGETNLTIPSDYTLKEKSIIERFLKELTDNTQDEMKTIEVMQKAKDKFIEMQMNIAIDGDKLSKYADLDIANTKYKQLPIVVALLQEIIHAISFVFKYNENEGLKKN